MAILISAKDKASASSEGLVRFATEAEASEGLRNDVAMSPALVKAQLDSSLNDIVDGAPAALDTLNELAAAINDDASVYQTITTITDDHESRLATLETGATAAAVAAELAVTQTGAGLENDGTYSADASTNYLSAATSLKDADDRLDAQIKTNADAISALGAGNVSALQTELDAVEASVGINADGTYTAQSGNYIASATSVRNEISLLDTQIKSNADAIALRATEADLTLAEGDISSLQSLADAHESSIGLDADGGYTAPSGSNYIDSASSVRNESILLDTQVKANADAIVLRALDTDLDAVDTRLTTAEGEIDTLQSDLATAQSDISSNDTDIADHETRITSLEGASTNQAEVDAIESSVGINTDGTFTANTGGNYIGSASSVRGEINALDSQVKTNADAIASNDSDISTINTNLAAKADSSVVTAISTELTATQSAAGFNADGTYSAHSGSNYIDGATTTKSALGLLDAQAKTNADDISNLETTVQTITSSGDSNSDAIDALQSELDATQTGAGLSTTGAYTAPGSSNYLSGATSLKDADNKLDTQIKSNADNIALKASSADLTTLTSRVSTNESDIATLQSDVSANESDIATNLAAIQSNDSDISALQTSVAAKASQTDLDAAEALLDTHEASLGLASDGSYSAHSGSNYMDSASTMKGALSLLDTQLASTQSDLDTAEASLATAQSDISDLETLADAHETAIGLSAAGAYQSRSGSNYLDSATSIRGEITLLDSQAKTNADAIASEASTRAAADSTHTTNISNLQTEVNAIESGAGLGSDGSYTADPSANYISSSTSLKDADSDLDAQIKTNADNIATNVSNISTNATAIATKASSASVTALQSEVDATQSGAGLGTNGAYSADGGSNYITGASSLKNADSLLDAQIKTNADAIALKAASSTVSALQTEVDAIESGVGLASDGSYTTPAANNYLGQSTLKADLSSLDSQVKTNADAIALRALDSDLSSLQSEVDATQSGAGLAANGNFVSYSGTNYVDSSTSLANAISTLDAAVKTRQDNIDTEASARSSADSTLQSAIDTVESSVGLQSDGSLSITGTNFLNSASSVVDGLDILDTNVNLLSQIQTNIKSSAGLSSDGTKTAYSSTNYIAGSLKAAIEALDTQVKSNADSISGLGGSDLANLQSELDDTQSSVGLDSDGLYVDRSGTNYIDSANTIAQEIGLLDTAVKSEETARTSADTAQVDRLEVLEHRCGGIMIDVPASSAVEMDATLSQFRSHGGPWQIDFSGFLSNGAVDIIMYGGQAVTNSSQHFIQKNSGDIVFTGNIADGASIRDDV